MSARPTHRPGPHELGQNLITDPDVIESIVAVVDRWPRSLPVVELAAGAGALTGPLHDAGRVVTAVDLDPRMVRRLRRAVPDTVVVEHGDLVDHRLVRPSGVVSNVPFHLTTPLLRRLLADDDCRRSLLLVQWEVARKRAGVGGTTQLTAQWWPWVDVTLVRRVPASAFRPRPSVDGGVIELMRRDDPLVDPGDRAAYQRLVRRVFAARGRGAVEMAGHVVGRAAARGWARDQGVEPRHLPRDLSRDAWVALHQAGAS